MQLINATTGWVLQDQRLMWTDDSGSSWRDITPRDLEPSSAKFDAGELAFFLDSSNGWVLATRPYDSKTPSDLFVWRTTDGGATWDSTRLDGPKVDPESAPPYFYPLALQFVDREVGWFFLAYASGNHGGVSHYATHDGGGSWVRPKPDTQLGGTNGSWGAVYFASVNDGWEAWDNGEDDVIVTHDGGQTWTRTSFPPPTGSLGHGRALLSSYEYGDLGAGEGVIPATHYGGTDPDLPKLGFYVTHDAGHTWSFAGRAPDDDGVFFFLSPQAWMQATASHLSITMNAGNEWDTAYVDWAKVAGKGDRCTFEPKQIAFADADHGWALLSSRVAGDVVVGTADGGATWRALAP